MEFRHTDHDCVAVEFTATVDEVAKITRFQFMRILRSKFMYALLACWVVAAIVAAALERRPGPIAALVAVLVFDVIYMVIIMRIAGRRAARKAVAREPSRWMEFSNEGARLGTALRDELTRWVAFSEVIVWDGFYMLRLRKTKLYAFVPRRAFSSHDDECEFREIAARHLKVHESRGA